MNIHGLLFGMAMGALLLHGLSVCLPVYCHI